MRTLITLALALAAPTALAGDPCGPQGFETADTLRQLLGIAPARVSKELQAARKVTCETLGDMTVCNMKYDTKQMQFDCDDFAWCFDQECKAQGIECWQANIGARGWGPWAEWSAHGINIIQIPPLDGDAEGEVRWALVEPQQKEDGLEAVATWTQPAGEDPSVPESVYPDIERYYEFFDNWTQAIYVFQDGHSPVAGEAPFTQHPDKVEQYKKLTGNDPTTYDSTPTGGRWQK